MSLGEIIRLNFNNKDIIKTIFCLYQSFSRKITLKNLHNYLHYPYFLQFLKEKSVD